MTVINIHLGDSLEAMKSMKEKQYDLAIVDPPYGIGAGSNKFINGTSKKEKKYYRENDWDIKPNKQYFDELFRASKNQIIFGANYFIENLKNTQCFIFWDKTIHGNSYADGELLWTSFNSPARYYRKNISQIEKEGERQHPTQKSINIYKWLLKNYAKPGDKIIDSHGGSMSIAIACIDMGFDLDCWEIDEEYFDAAVKRIQNHVSQLNAFIPQPEINIFK